MASEGVVKVVQGQITLTYAITEQDLEYYGVDNVKDLNIQAVRNRDAQLSISELLQLGDADVSVSSWQFVESNRYVNPDDVDWQDPERVQPTGSNVHGGAPTIPAPAPDLPLPESQGTPVGLETPDEQEQTVLNQEAERQNRIANSLGPVPDEDRNVEGPDVQAEREGMENLNPESPNEPDNQEDLILANTGEDRGDDFIHNTSETDGDPRVDILVDPEAVDGESTEGFSKPANTTDVDTTEEK